jgi:hypothetical protein
MNKGKEERFAPAISLRQYWFPASEFSGIASVLE